LKFTGPWWQLVQHFSVAENGHRLYVQSQTNVGFISLAEADNRAIDRRQLRARLLSFHSHLTVSD
jgi:hypothetical protein